jgi:hypothetical protein
MAAAAAEEELAFLDKVLMALAELEEHLRQHLLLAELVVHLELLEILGRLLMLPVVFAAAGVHGVAAAAVGHKFMVATMPVLVEEEQCVLFGPVTHVHSHQLAWGHHELVHTN